MPQVSEPSIVEYARYYGLARDHQAFHPFDSIPILDESLYSASIEEISPRLDDLLEVDTLEKNLLTERMFVDADTAKLLASVTQPAKTPQRFDDDLEKPAMRRKRLKHDLTLLHSDHESDMRELFQRFEPNLQNEFLPFESLDEDEDEGLAWPSKYLDLPNEIWKRLTIEKLEIPVEALQYLSEVLSYSKNDKGKALFEFDEKAYLTYKRGSHFIRHADILEELMELQKASPRPVTPPLLPLSPIYVPFVPSSDVGHLGLLSEHSSPTKEQLRTTEKHIFAQDNLKASGKVSRSSPQSSDPMLLDSDSIGAIYSPLKGIKDLPSSPPDDRLPPRNLKVEVPLVVAEPRNLISRVPKHVPIQETLTGLIPSFPPLLPDFNEDEIMEEINTFFDETIKPIATKAERSIEQEQLQEADTTTRVKVPIIDFSLPRAPWNIINRLPQSDGKINRQDPFLQDMKASHFKDHVWLLSGSIERELQWTPFPAAMGRVELRESIHDDETLSRFLARQPPIDTSLLVWKPEGLRLFDSNEQYDEQELEEGTFEEGTDLRSLIRKRKIELSEAQTSSAEGQHYDVQSQGMFNLVDAERPTVLNSLEDFMHVRSGNAHRKQRPFHQNVLPRSTVQNSAADTEIHWRHNDESDEGAADKHLRPAIPYVTLSNKRSSFIMSVAILRNRRLVRELQKLLPAVEFIERDWSAHLQAQEIPLKSKQGTSATVPDLSTDEADIIVSPSTGLILTTLQKIKQQALPGQIAQSSIRKRVRCTAPRYETLIIVISADSHTNDHDQNSPTGELDHNDSEAIALFVAFCSNLEDDVQVIFIPSGSEELSRWVVSSMLKHSAPYSVQLIQDESQWELFLRRAGLNAFAAQAILSELNEKNMGMKGNGDFGLTAFIKMSADERLARFEGLFGGRGLLSKINDVLEARW